MSDPIDVWVSENHPHYQVHADGKVIDNMTSKPGFPPLTWSQQWDIAAGYREALTNA